MKKITIMITILIILVLSGCGGSVKDIYLVKPTPIQHGKSKYQIDNLKFTLVEKMFKNDTSKYKKEAQLKEYIFKNIEKELKASKILGNDVSSYKLDIDLHYDRIFTPIPKTSSLQKPAFFYTIKVYNNDKSQLLVEYSIEKSTTKYAYLKELAVAAEILALQWDYEDEPLDIDLICKTLVEDVLSFGK